MNVLLLLVAVLIAPVALSDPAFTGLDLAGILAAGGSVITTIRRAEK